jgi:hypothetical protein
MRDLRVRVFALTSNFQVEAVPLVLVGVGTTSTRLVKVSGFRRRGALPWR